MLYGEIKVSQGSSDFFQKSEDFEKNLALLKDKIREFFNLKNVNFLFGSGTSSGAIPTMSKLYEELDFDNDEKEMKHEFDCIVKKEGNNLEKCLNVMYSARSYYSGLDDSDKERQKIIENQKSLYDSLINKIESHIFNSINVSFDSEEKQKVLAYYKTFYQKLALRSKDNSRIRVFTTNNDLFNETALDVLNIHYINGFSGGITQVL